MPQPCALDLADEGGLTLQEAGQALGITRERIRQIELALLQKIAGKWPHLSEFLGLAVTKGQRVRSCSASAITGTHPGRGYGRRAVGLRLRERREDLGVLIGEVAKKMGWLHTKCSRLELGDVEIQGDEHARYEAAIESIARDWAQLSREGGERARAAAVVIRLRVLEVHGKGVGTSKVTEHGIVNRDYWRIMAWRRDPPDELSGADLRAIVNFCKFHGHGPEWVLGVEEGVSHASR
jgi:transcriptional regulator with XRE-family HTH domain